MRCAVRKWEQETGLERNQLFILPDKHFDDTSSSTRLIAAVYLANESDGKSPSPTLNPKGWESPGKISMRCEVRGHPLQAVRKPAYCDRCRSRSQSPIVLACGVPDCQQYHV